MKKNYSSLLRYHSTPSSFFSNLLDDNGDEEFPNPVTAASNHRPEAKAEESYFTGHQQQRKKSKSNAREFLRYESSLSTVSKQERKESTIQNRTIPHLSTAAMHSGGSRRAPNFPAANNNSNYSYTNQNNLDSTSSNQNIYALVHIKVNNKHHRKIVNLPESASFRRKPPTHRNLQVLAGNRQLAGNFFVGKQ